MNSNLAFSQLSVVQTVVNSVVTIVFKSEKEVGLLKKFDAPNSFAFILSDSREDVE